MGAGWLYLIGDVGLWPIGYPEDDPTADPTVEAPDLLAGAVRELVEIIDAGRELGAEGVGRSSDFPLAYMNLLERPSSIGL